MKESFKTDYERNEIFSEENTRESLLNLSLKNLNTRIEKPKTDPKDRLLNKKKVGKNLTQKEKKYVEKIKLRLRKEFQEGFKRMEPHLEMLYKKCKEKKILFEFALIPLIESHFKKDATPNGNAKGLWQITDATAKDYQIKERGDAFDVKKSSEVGLSICKNNYEYFKRLNPKASVENIFKFSAIAYNAGRNKAKALYDFSKGDFLLVISKLKTKSGVDEINSYIKKTNSQRKYKLSAITFEESIKNPKKSGEISRYAYKIFAARDSIKSISEKISDKSFTHLVSSGESVFSIFKNFGIETSDENYEKFKKINNKKSLALNVSERISLPIKIEYLEKGEGLYSLIKKEKIEISAKKLFEHNKSVNPYFKKIKDVNSIGISTPVFIPNISKKNKTSAEKQNNIEMEAINKFSRMTYEEIKEKIKEMPKISEKLKGRTFVIDPGHGGNDPGTNPETKDGDGNDQHLYEASLVYDTCLRIMKNILLNGGKVFFTHYSETVGMWNNKIANDFPRNYRTQKYNIIDKENIKEDRASHSTAVRKKVSNHFTKKYKDVTFMAIHADYLPGSTKRMPIKIYYNDSRSFAKKLAKHIDGAISVKKGYNVLTENRGVTNKAEREILIELANTNNINDAYRLRNARHRESSANIVSNGLIKTLGK